MWGNNKDHHIAKRPNTCILISNSESKQNTVKPWMGWEVIFKSDCWRLKLLKWQHSEKELGEVLKIKKSLLNSRASTLDLCDF